MLDAFGHTRDLRGKVRELFGAWKRATAEIAQLEGSEQEKNRLLDLWQFQRREIEGSSLRPGEDVELEAERRVQQNAGKLLETAGAAYEALYEAPESAWTTARAVAKKLDELARIDAMMEPVRQALEPALIAMQDVSYSLRDYLGRMEANPARLEEIELRLSSLDKLKRKYGASVDEILVFLNDVTRKVNDVETVGERLGELKREQARMASEYEKSANELTARRTLAASQLGQRVEQELKPLAMDRTIFRVTVEPATEWSETGTDRVQFLVSANIGEEPKPMERIASGGELSRIALALKTCLVGPAGRAAVPQRTLVFDEIDTGIGGRAAEGVARRLKGLAAENQVLCVTHLPQIACFADHHYLVGKFERNGRTVAEIAELDAKASTEEIGRMLSGEMLTPEALRNAEELVRAARA
jgi:DNA repair protein RecN (Recombination protein N)